MEDIETFKNIEAHILMCKNNIVKLKVSNDGDREIKILEIREDIAAKDRLLDALLEKWKRESRRKKMQLI